MKTYQQIYDILDRFLENGGSYYVNYENNGMDPSYIHDTYFVIFNDEDIAVDAYFRKTSIGG